MEKKRKKGKMDEKRKIGRKNEKKKKKLTEK